MLEKFSREDYTEELNETSPNTKYFNKYSKQEAKFLSKPSGRSITPHFEKRNTFGYLDKGSTNNKPSLINGLNNQTNAYNKNLSLTYKYSPKNTRPLHEQIPPKNIINTAYNTPNASNREYATFSQNVNEILDEVTSKNEKPTTQILNKRDYYLGSQGSFKYDIHPHGTKHNKSMSSNQLGYPYFNREETPTSNFKNKATDGFGKDFNGTMKVGMSEKIIQK